ncbi:conserved hypothetical protein [Hahella chejuensis KCTC 2396]|uniref:Uncharacterized protein n=1 Tax=Hahella chejuensis (strain KCTC 2396) TaxID=349521 RepID=Q2S8T1_HAHCH|nr:hypothetical protein [Hahella chejuensis]ABC32943.1 conserved hypothetical protein [Hahella chejuensis KCTC 2396]
MHTLLVIFGGLSLLAICLMLGRYFGALALAALIFIPVWAVAAAINMWIGVSHAGYSIMEEAPIFLLIFAIPSAVALFCWWRFSRD